MTNNIGSNDLEKMSRVSNDLNNYQKAIRESNKEGVTNDVEKLEMSDLLSELEYVAISLGHISSLFDYMSQSWFTSNEPDRCDFIRDYKSFINIFSVIQNMTVNQKISIDKIVNGFYKVY